MWDKIRISELPEEYSIAPADYLVVNYNDRVTSKLSYANFLDTLTSENIIWDGNIVFTGQVVLPPEAETDPIFMGSPAFTITQEDIDRWNEAYSWGDHHLEGYLTAGDIPTGFLMPGDNVSLLFNDPPYVTEAELNAVIDGLDFVTLEELTNILDNEGYLKPGDPISLLVNDVPYLTESALICILDGKTSGCNPNPDHRGWLKRAINFVPQDKVSELANDVPYLTEAEYVNDSKNYLRRRDNGVYMDDNIELANGMGYLEHTYDGAPLIDYNLEVLSNVNADDAKDGETIVKSGDNWVAGSILNSLAGLRFIGPVDVSFPDPIILPAHRVGDVYVQHKDNGNDAYADPNWDIINLPQDTIVKNGTFMILMSNMRWVLAGTWNDHLQSDWDQDKVYEPSFIKNKPTKLSEFENDMIGAGKIEYLAGPGLKETGLDATANQFMDSEKTFEVSYKTDGGIIIDPNTGEIEIDWSGNVGDGDIVIRGSDGIIVTNSDVPHANQYCETTTTVRLDPSFKSSHILALEANYAQLQADYVALKSRVEALERKH